MTGFVPATLTAAAAPEGAAALVDFARLFGSEDGGATRPRERGTIIARCTSTADA